MKNKIKNLYANGLAGKYPALDANGVLNAVSRGWITTEDAVEIVGEDNALDIIKAAKLNEISKACNAAIVGGIDLEFDGEAVHFNLSIEDQSNIANLFRVVELGGTEYPYQADGGVCRIYTAAEIAQIYLAAQTLITSQTTYHNTMKTYIQSLDDVDAVANASYGMTLPDEYMLEMNHKLSVAQQQTQAIVEKLGAQL